MLSRRLLCRGISGGRDYWWWSPQLFGEEAEECFFSAHKNERSQHSRRRATHVARANKSTITPWTDPCRSLQSRPRLKARHPQFAVETQQGRCKTPNHQRQPRRLGQTSMKSEQRFPSMLIMICFELVGAMTHHDHHFSDRTERQNSVARSCWHLSILAELTMCFLWSGGSRKSVGGDVEVAEHGWFQRNKRVAHQALLVQ